MSKNASSTEGGRVSPDMECLESDMPIEKSSQDILGFGPFSRALATGLVERAPRDGFVVGLQARWGMGKSSAVNLCLEHVRGIDASKVDGDQIVVQAFNPWFYSGVDDLTAGYLTSLSDAVEKALGPREASLIVRSWRGLKRWVKKLSHHSDALGATTAGAVTLFSGGKAAPLSGAIKGTIVSALKSKPSANDLSKRFNKLVNQLGGKHGRVLLVIDDLDRLQPGDLRQVLSLVKTFGNLEGVTHLLVYDREILDFALSDMRFERDGRRLPSYREKIVQAEFDLPNATHWGLEQLIARGIDPLMSAEPQFDDLTWHHAKKLALYTYLRSPRDVVRFTNGLSVIWPSVTGEAYFPDLFVLELWRLFDRDFYEGIRDHRAVMTGDDLSMIGSDERKEIINNIIERVPAARRSQVRDVFARLFPSVSEHLKEAPFIRRNKVDGRWRIGDPKGFDVFFRMSPSEDEYTQNDLARLKSSLSNEMELNVWLKDAISRKVASGGTFLPKLLHALRQMITGPSFASFPLLNFIIKNGEVIIKQSMHEPAIGLQRVPDDISGIASDCMAYIPETECLIFLKEILPHTGISTRAVIVASQYYPHTEKSETSATRHMRGSDLSIDDARNLLDEFAAEIRKNPDLLPDALLGQRALYLWVKADGPAVVSNWIHTKLNDPATIVFVIDCVMSYVTSTEGTHRELRSIPDFFNVKAIQKAASSLLSAESIPLKNQELVNEFVKDCQRRERLQAGAV